MPFQKLTLLLDFLRRARSTRRICGLAFLSEASVRRRTRVDETLTQQDAQPMTRASIRNDVSAQPVPQQISCVVSGSPWRAIFEQERDDRLHGDDIDDTFAVAKPLIDQTSKPTQPSGAIGEQAGPCVPKQRFRIGKREQGFTGHVAPATLMTCRDQRVKGRLQCNKLARQRRRGSAESPQPRLTRESCCRERPTRCSRPEESRSRTVAGQKKARDRVAANLVVRELGTDLERRFRRSSQQSIATQPGEGGGIDSADDIKTFAVAKLQLGESQKCRLSRVREPPVRHLAPPNEPGPHLVHCVGVSQRSTGNLPANEQIHHDKPAEEFSRPRIGIEVFQLRKRSDYVVDLRVAQRRHDMFRNTAVEALVESVEHDLLAVDGGHGDHFDGALPSGADQVAKRVEPVFGGGVRPVNDEKALRRTQFAQGRRERTAQRRLELDRELRDLAQVDAQGLQAVRIGVGRSGETQYCKSTLAYTGLAAYDHRLSVRDRLEQLHRRSASIEAHTSVTIARGELGTHGPTRLSVDAVEYLPAVLMPSYRGVE